MRLTVREIVAATRGTLITGDPEDACLGVSTDSRAIDLGDLFVPLVGTQYDGHDFIREALRRGAAGFLAQRAVIGITAAATHIRVADTLQALTNLASWAVREKLRAPIVAVAGSNGKTTAKELIAQVLASRWRTHATPGNLNTEIGVPLTILNAPARTEWLILEMGTTARGDLRKLCALAPPRIGVLTGIAEEHLATLGDLSGVLAAELELLENLESIAIVNGDNDDLRRAAGALCQKGIITFGFRNQNNYVAEILEIARAGTCLRLRTPAGAIDVMMKLLGRPAAWAALAASAVAQQLGLSLPEIATALESMRGVPGRLELRQRDAVTILYDAYNANPASMREAILCAAQIRELSEELIFVLGDMLELGACGESAHKDIGKLVGAVSPDRLVVIGTWAQLIGDEAARAGVQVQRFSTTETAAAATALAAELRECGQKSFVLIKASRGMRLERICEALQRAGSDKLEIR